MSYIGFTPETELSRRFSVRYSGNDSAISFVLPTSTVTDPKDLDVYVNNVHQDPFIAYTVTQANASINFSEAPQTGTNNILVVVRDQQKFASIGVDDKSITARKLATQSVSRDSIIDGEVTASKLAVGAAAGNLGANTISANELENNSVTSNILADGSVTESKLAGQLGTVAISNLTVVTSNTEVTNVVVFNANSVTLGEVGTTATINLAQGTYFSANQTDNCTWSFTRAPSTDKATGFILELTSGGGNTRDAYTTTWPSSVRWSANAAPELTKGENGVDLLVFTTDDGGTNFRGVFSVANSGGLGVAS
tara:strand:+ start:2492 stop:3418 length:927 start_codon:yes stop_codon:yes gene_type:complete